MSANKLRFVIVFLFDCLAHEGLSGVMLRLKSRIFKATFRTQGEFLIRPRSADVSVYLNIYKRNIYNISRIFEVTSILDIGAYNGMTAVYFSESFPAAKIYAYEPDEDNYQVAIENTKNVQNIKLYQRAVSSRRGRIFMTDTTDFTLGRAISEGSDQQGIGCESITFKDCLLENNLTVIDILKINIEGAEKELFESMSAADFTKIKCIFVDLHDRKVPGCFQSLVDKLVGQSWELEVQRHFLVLYNTDLI